MREEEEWADERGGCSRSQSGLFALSVSTTTPFSPIVVPPTSFSLLLSPPNPPFPLPFSPCLAMETALVVSMSRQCLSATHITQRMRRMTFTPRGRCIVSACCHSPFLFPTFSGGCGQPTWLLGKTTSPLAMLAWSPHPMCLPTSTLQRMQSTSATT